MRFEKRHIKPILLRVIGFTMYFSGAYFALDKLFRNKGIYILMYHKIAEKDDSCYYQDIAVKKEEFIKQLNYFKNKYCCISMSEAVSIINSKEAINKNYMVFTFDDGYLDNLKHGMDLLKKYNIRPIVYLTANKIETKEPIWTETVDYIFAKSDKVYCEINIAGERILGKTDSKKGLEDLIANIKNIFIKMPQDIIMVQIENLIKKLGVRGDGRKNELLNWDNANELMASGWEIGSHTMNHVNLAAESEDTVISELSVSRGLIEDRLGCKVEDFAYPYGRRDHYNNFIIETVKKYYRSAVTTTEGINQCGDDLYHLRRVMIANHHGLVDIRVKLLKVKITGFFKKRSG